MKRIFLAILTIFLIQTLTLSIETLKKGTYTCAYQHNNKNSICKIHTDGKGTSLLEGDCDAVEDEVSFVKEYNCEYNRPATKNYVCEYANASCYVTIFENGASYTSCKDKTNFQYTEQLNDTNQASKHAKEGKCRPEL